MAVSKVGPTGLSSAVGALGKNVIINGAHTIDQRAAETRTGLGAADFRIDDQWELISAGSSSSRWTASVETAAGPRDNSKWLKLLCTTGDASPGAAEAAYIRHVIEGQQGQSLMNTATTGVRDMTVSMYFIASLASGSFPAKVCISFATFDGTGRQFLSDQSITAASTWQKISFTIPADATAELANDTGAGAAIVIGLVGGSNSVAAEGWSANATDFITSNTQNWGATADNFIGYTDVQLEPGPVATDFEREDFGVTYLKCKRYLPFYFDAANNGNFRFAFGAAYSTSYFQCILPFLVPPRAAVTISVDSIGNWRAETGDGTGITVTAIATQPSVNADNFGMWSTANFQSSSGYTAKEPGFLRPNGTSGIMIASCEL